MDKTDAGIYLPESAKDTPKEGKVIALGSGILNKETGSTCHSPSRRAIA